MTYPGTIRRLNRSLVRTEYGVYRVVGEGAMLMEGESRPQFPRPIPSTSPNLGLGPRDRVEMNPMCKTLDYKP